MLEYLIYQCKYFLAFTAEGIDGKTTKKKKKNHNQDCGF